MVINRTDLTDKITVGDKVSNGTLEDAAGAKDTVAASPMYALTPEGAVLADEVTTTVAGKSKVHTLPVYKFVVAGVEIPIKSFKIKRELSRGVSGTVTTWEPFADETIVGSDFTLTLEYRGESVTLATGRVSGVTTTPPQKTLTLTLEGVERALYTDILLQTGPPTTGVFEFTDTRADDVAKAILEGTEFTLVECPPTQVSVKFKYERRWQALQLLADITNSDLWVDDQKGVHIGQLNSNVTLTRVKSQQITSDTAGLYNRIIVVGGHDDEGNVIVGIAEDRGSILTYGVKARTENVAEVRDTSTAVLLAQAYLSKFNSLHRVVKITLRASLETARIREGATTTVDGVEYKLTSVTFTPMEVTVEAAPTRYSSSLLNYLQDQLQRKTENAITSSTFSDSTQALFTIYEEILLGEDYYGGSVVRYYTVDNEEYKIIGVVHFYAPENFAPDGATLHIRKVSEDSLSFALVVNGTFIPPTPKPPADDGDELWEVNIPAEGLRPGWNDVYVLDTSPRGGLTSG